MTVASGPQLPFDFEDGSIRNDPKKLREWWHLIIAQHRRRFNCYAFFLLLPSDDDATSYLTNNLTELDLISGEHTLIIVVNSNWVQGTAGDHVVYWRKERSMVGEFLVKIWGKIVTNYVQHGYSTLIARHFNIDLVDFPCMVLFEDIRSTNHVVVALKDMDAAEIATKMRWVFSTITKAVSQQKSPLDVIISEKNSEEIRRYGKSILSDLRTIAGRTLETAMDVLIKVAIK